MRSIELTNIARVRYAITRRGDRPLGDGFSLVEQLSLPARWLRAALLDNPRALAELAHELALEPTTRDQLERAADRVITELARGPLARIRLWRRDEPLLAYDKIRLEPPLPPTPPKPPPAPEDHWLKLEVITAKDEPAPDIDYELMLPDGERKAGRTDADGRVEIRGIKESGHFKLEFPGIDDQAPVPVAPPDSEREAIAYLREVLSLPVDELHTIRLPPEAMDAHYVEFDDVFFSFASTALLPETKDHTPPLNADGEPITGLGLCVAVLQYTEQFDGEKTLLILGHTDTVGSDEENVTLSQWRAQVVYGLVAGDRQAFMDAVDAPHLTDKQTKAKILIPDKNFVLDWVAQHTGWPCSLAENYNDHWAATNQLQEHYNEHGAEFGGSAQLDVDRDFGKQTWGAVFDIYQDHIARTLEISHDELRGRQAKIPWTQAQTKHAGCGESHPLDLIGRDGVRSATNRRAEAVFFDPGEAPALECFAGGCAGRACELFQNHLIQRAPLPLSWKSLWKVEWERVAEPARFGEVRDIVLKAPKLDDGATVTFVIEQDVNGKRTQVAELEAIAEGERARVSFGRWFDPEYVEPVPATLAVDEPFPTVRFHVRARTPEREVDGRRALIYADTLEAEIGHELVHAELSADHVDPATCLIHSPWGCKQAEIDEFGLLIVHELPPGGVLITIDEDPYFPV